MSLNILVLEEEPTIDISTVGIQDASDLFPTDPELPEEFFVQDEVDTLQDTALALEALGVRLACEGMCTATARDIDKLIPGYLRKQGGISSFTNSPSLEGLADGINDVKKHLMGIIANIRKYVTDLYKRFRAWLIQKFTSPEAQKVNDQVAQFVAKRQNREAMTFMADLPEKPEDAANEISTLMTGDTKQFATACTDQLQGLLKSMGNIETMLMENPTQFRLASGVISVKELFKEDANSAINAILKKAAGVVDSSMKTRNYEQFSAAIASIDAVTAELIEFEKAMVINDTVSEEQGEGKAVRLDKLFDNINTVTDDMNRVDIKTQVANMAAAVEHIVKISEETKIEEILEMIPEDVPADQHSVFGQKIASLYRRIAKLGADILRLWKLRADSVTTINKIGNALVGLVDSFEKAVINSAGSLVPEQKEQLVKALANKGFTISF